MRIFVLKARKGPTSPHDVKGSIGSSLHLEVVVHSILNAFFLSKNLREDVVFHAVLEGTHDYSRIITFDSREDLSFDGFHEQAVIQVIEDALIKASSLGKDCTVDVRPGVSVRAGSLEKLLQALSKEYPLYLLHKKGEDIRDVTFTEDAVFILTDHIPLPKNLLKYMIRLGAEKLRLGPKVLFAAHCVSIVNNELDRQWKGV